MTRWLALLLCGVLAACGTTAPGNESAPAFVPDALPTPVEVYFWLNEWGTEADDPRILVTDGHPCGAIAVMAVTSIPPDTALIEAEVVTEYDAFGEELATWRMPVDFVVDEVRGDMLGIANNNDLALWVDRTGRMFHREPGTATQTPVACPAFERYGQSSYLRCFSTPDAATGRARLIAWQDVCT